MTVVFRYEIPVDGEWHDLELSGQILQVASRKPDLVELWAFQGADLPRARRLQAFGTGQPLPEDTAVLHVGTALAPGGFVWHLFEAVAFG